MGESLGKASGENAVQLLKILGLWRCQYHGKTTESSIWVKWSLLKPVCAAEGGAKVTQAPRRSSENQGQISDIELFTLWEFGLILFRM